MPSAIHHNYDFVYVYKHDELDNKIQHNHHQHHNYDANVNKIQHQHHSDRNPDWICQDFWDRVRPQRCSIYSRGG